MNQTYSTALELPTADGQRLRGLPGARSERIPRAAVIAACRLPLGLIALATCLLTGLDRQTPAATLESQWRRLPEVSVKPESGASAKKSPLAGGNGWQESAQEPDSVPVQFYVYFKSSESVVTATLAGQSAHEEDPYSDEDPDNVFIQSEPATANLQPNRTYTLTLSGADVYSAEVHLAAPSLYDIFQTATVGKQPARLYNVYFFSPDDQKWEKVCPYRFPHSPSMDTWQSINLTFQVQVRPDLGARPVTRPGQRAIGPEDQPDDAWTREEPEP